MQELLNQHYKAIIIGSISVFLFIIAAIGSAFDVFNGVRDVSAPEPTTTVLTPDPTAEPVLKQQNNITTGNISGDGAIIGNNGNVTINEAPTPTPTPDPQSWYEQGVESYKAGQYRDAVQFLTLALDAEADIADNALMLRAHSNFESGMYDAALLDLSEIYRRDEKVEALYLRGRVYAVQGKWFRAQDDFTTYLKAYPGHISVHMQRGLAYASDKKWEQAIADFDYVINNQLDSRSWTYSGSMLGEAYFQVGLVYIEIGQWEKAVANLTEALNINNDNVEIYRSRGDAFTALEAYEQASSDYNYALLLNPLADSVYKSRGDFYKKQGMWEAAIADYEDAIDRNPNNTNAYAELGMAYLEYFYDKDNSELWRMMVETCDQALALDDTNAQAYFCRGIAFSKLIQVERSIEDFNNAIKYDSNLYWAYIWRAEAHMRLCEIGLVIANYNAVLASASSDSDVYARADSNINNLAVIISNTFLAQNSRYSSITALTIIGTLSAHGCY